MTASSLLILGTDTVLAVPATAVQLAHACLAAGYDAVVPATWGDELIAAHATARVESSDTPLVLCSCPLVARRLVDQASTLSPMLLSTVSPPVATALYLRALYSSTAVHISYVGSCPGADDESIDVRMSTQDLLQRLSSHGIDVMTQPTEFDSVIPPDRRRFFSEPGGMVARSALGASTAIELHEIAPDDLVTEVAQRLLARVPSLIDVGPALGCVCSGAVATRNPQVARSSVRALEPPRATSSILDHAIAIGIERALPLPRASVPQSDVAADVVQNDTPPAEVHLPAATHSPAPATNVSVPAVALEVSDAAVAVAPQRRSPQGGARPVLSTMPHARTEPGRQLPRAYVARRRSTPRSLRALGGGGGRTSSSSPTPSQARSWWWLAIGVLGVASGIGLAWLLGART